MNIGYKVYVLNPGNHENILGTIHLIADRNQPPQVAKACAGKHFDIVFDGSDYTPQQTQIAMDNINSVWNGK